jgi:prepilin-type N-terminal cleavage/methylation domain-containing protein
MRADRTSASARRGSTLLEVMAAMVVMLIGAAGVASVNTLGARLDGDGRKITRATAIAEDLAQQIMMWGYNDPRLTNRIAANDDNIGDVWSAYERDTRTDLAAAGVVDHGEADLTLGGMPWYGIPTADVQAGGYQRYWNVSFNDPAKPGTLLDANLNGTPDGMRIAVVVRWSHMGDFARNSRRIVVFTMKVNPNDQ